MNNEKLMQKIVEMEQDIRQLKKRNYWKGYFQKAFQKSNIIVGIGSAFIVTSIIVYAATVTKPWNFAENNTISSSEVNSNFDTLYALVNGNLDNNNISGISASKITSGVVDVNRLPVKQRIIVSATNKVSETSTAWVDIPNMSGSLTLANGGDVLALFNGGGFCLGIVSSSARIRLIIDGTEKATTLAGGDWQAETVSLMHLEYLSAGVHTFKVQWCLSGSSQQVQMSSNNVNNFTRSLIAIEL